MKSIMQKKNLKRAIYALLAMLFAINAKAQVDTAFWFAVPYVNVHHGLEYIDNYGGAKPFYFKISTLDQPATVTISQPAYNNGQGRVLPQGSFTIPANETYTYEIDQAIKDEIVVSREGNKIEDKGIYIHSSAKVTVYYENATVQNPDLFSLKGKNALGTEFYTPFQTLWPNDPKHNANEDDPVKEYWPNNNEGVIDRTQGIFLTPDSAFSAFDIVAAEYSVLEITPATDIIGHKKGETFTITLEKGQTYSARALRQGVVDTARKDGFDHWRCQQDNYCWGLTVTDNKDEDNLSGSHIKVINPKGKIAITLKDDSIFENDEEGSFSGGCEDFIGDQLVPIDLIGKEYIVMQGSLIPEDVKEHVFIVAVENGTKVTATALGADGTYMWDESKTLQAGETFTYSLCKDINNVDVCSPYTHIVSSENVYVLHASGYNCELAAAILPPVDICTGSQQVGFTRTYGGNGDEALTQQDQENDPERKRKFYMNLMVRDVAGSSDGFEVLTNGVADLTATQTIQNADFTPINGTPWKIARIQLNNDFANGAHLIRNTNTLFHMSFINSTSYNFGKGFVLTGSEYGYFSNYDENIPDAYVYNPKYPETRESSIYIDSDHNNGVTFIAEGGVTYKWHSLQFFDSLTDKWIDIDISKLLPNDEAENTGLLAETIKTEGDYRITVDIKNDCYLEDAGKQYSEILNVYVKEMNPPLRVTDTVCDTDDDPLVFLSEEFRLNELYDTIMYHIKKDPSDNSYLEGWYNKIDAAPYLIGGFETASPLTVTDAFNAEYDITVNPVLAGNTSSNVLHIVKNDDNSLDPTGYYVDIKLDEPLDLTIGNSITFKYLFDGSNVSAGNTELHSVKLMLIGEGFEASSNEIDIPESAITNPKWIESTVSFSTNEYVAGFTTLRVYFNAGYTFENKIGYYVDDLIKNNDDHYEIISDSTNYTFTGRKNYIYALIKNDDYKKDTFAEQIIYVHPIGRAEKHFKFGPFCRLETDSLCGINLRSEHYNIGGGLVATKDWFRDPELTDSIEDVYNVCVMDYTVLYARINDHCDRVGTITFDVNPIPVLQNNKLSKIWCADKDKEVNAIVDFNQFNDEFTENDSYPWQFTWYSDEARTNLLADNSAITVADSAKFYGKINKEDKLDCSALIEIDFTIVPTIPDTLVIDDMCLNNGQVDFSNSKLGSSLTFSGDGFNGNIFDPLVAGVGSHEVTMTYVNEIGGKECSWDYKYTATVLDTPHVALNPEPLDFEDDAIYVLLGNDTTVDATVTGGTPFETGDPYTYLWTSDPTNSLVSSPTDEDLQTVEIVKPVDYTFVATDAKGCTGTRLVPVIDSGGVVRYIEIVNEPICIGEDVTITAKFTGGAGDFEITWKYVESDVLIENANIEKSRSHSITIAPEDTVDIFIQLIDHLDGHRTIDTIVTVIVNPNPVIAVEGGNTQEICQYATASINGEVTGGNPAYTHNWSGDTQIIDDANAGIPNVNSDLEVGEYNLQYTVTDVNGCKDVQDVVVSINQNPVIEQPATTTYEICDGLELDMEVEVSGSTDNIYKWNGTEADLALLSSTDITNPTFTTAGAGTMEYEFTAVNGDNCSDTATVIITVHPKPILSGLNDSAGCVGDPINLNIGIESGTPDFTVEWNDQRFSPIDNFETAFTSNVAEDVHVSIEVTDAHECKDTLEATFSIKENPVNYIPEDTVLCSRYDHIIKVTDDSNAIVTWTGDVSIIKDSSDPTKVVLYTEGSGDYELHYVILNENNCDSEGTLTIEILESPYYIAKDTAYCVARQDTIYTTSQNSVRSSYNWEVIEGEGEIAKKLGKDAIYLATASGTSTVRMIATATKYECYDTVDVTINVYENPGVTITNNGGFLPFGMDDGVVNTSITKETVAPYKYAWTGEVDGSADSLSPNAPLHYFNFLDPTTVQVIMFDGNYCSDTADISFYTNDTTFNVKDLPICLKDSVNRMGEVKPSGVDFGNSYSYEWRTLEGEVVLTKQEWDIHLTKDETYILSINNGYVTASDTFNITVHKDPTINIVATSSFNQSTSNFYTGINVLIEANLKSYADIVDSTWTIYTKTEDSEKNILVEKDSATINETFLQKDYYYADFYASDIYGCYVRGQKILYIEESDRIEITLDPLAKFCVGDTTMFTATPNVDYILWDVYNVEYEKLGTFRGDTVSAIIKNADTVYVRAYADNSTTLSTPLLPDIDTLIAYDYPKIHIVGPEEVCEGSNEIYFASEDANTAPVNKREDMIFNWTIWSSTLTAENIIDETREAIHSDELFSDIVVVGDKDDGVVGMNDTVEVYWDVEDIDSLYLTVDNHRCILKDTLKVTIHPNPKPLFDFYETISKTKEKIYIGKEVQFENFSDSVNREYEYKYYKYYWDFIGEDIYTSEKEHPVYIYHEMGDYDVQLYIRNSETGCFAKYVQVLEVVPNPECYMTFPNAFTPEDADFRIFKYTEKEGVSERGYDFRIFNKVGTELFDTQLIDNGWDGTFDGKSLNADTYVFHVKYTCENGETKIYKSKKGNPNNSVQLLK